MQHQFLPWACVLVFCGCMVDELVRLDRAHAVIAAAAASAAAGKAASAAATGTLAAPLAAAAAAPIAAAVDWL
ncbi:hypothetical protein BDF19DRAFT_420927 [Syncephalis fuscata]|nr:hypothetical protein BDF19DRAFT_420927 [Syncephalis fuscata]